jgi:hypothetical protein
MKFGILIMFILLTVPFATAAVNDIIKTQIHVELDKNTGVLRITGEGLNWAKTLNLVTVNNTNTTSLTLGEGISDDLEILMLRSFGNMTDIENLVQLCNNKFNFTEKWESCIKLNSNLSVQMMDMVNKSSYDMCLSNVSTTINNCEIDKLTQQNDMNRQIGDLNTELSKVKSQKSWFTIGTFVFLAVAVFVVYKYRGFGKRGSAADERDKSIDRSF